MAGLLLGCIADDFTGATDLANNLVRAGMRTVQVIGVPEGGAEMAPADETGGGQDGAQAVVVSLKSRTIPAARAVEQSLAALRWLRGQGARQIYFKYCSTFDSTDAGNIGPVADALMAELGTDFTIACPAFPENKRTVFKGYLFAGEVLLNESGMQHHPLTPMTDPNLVRVLQRQTPSKVGLIDYTAVADAISDADLRSLAAGCKDLPLVTAGSGVAIGLPANWDIRPDPRAAALPPAPGRMAVVSGSCSQATNAQVRAFIAAGGPAFFVDPMRLAAGEKLAEQALTWARAQDGEAPVLVYTTSEPAALRQVQEQLGVARAASWWSRACAGWSWRAARPRAPASRRWV